MTTANDRMSRTVKCSACGEDAPATQQEDAPDDGWTMSFDSFGYYGGFSDDIRRNEKKNVMLCHDCCVKILEMFPLEFQERFRGGHPASNRNSDTPCCKYAWRGTTIFGKYTKDGEGRRYHVPGAATQHAWPDGKTWHDDIPEPTHFWLDGELYLGNFVDGEWRDVVLRERDEDEN